MGVIFLNLLNMSITASWLILAVLGIRLLFRRIPKWITCLLWGVVAIRLIFPFSIESVFSLQPSAEPIRTSTMVEGELIDTKKQIPKRFPQVIFSFKMCTLMRYNICHLFL